MSTNTNGVTTSAFEYRPYNVNDFNVAVVPTQQGNNLLQSNNVSDLVSALSKAQGELGHANKNSLNPHFKSKYADLSEVIDTFRPVFADNGLSVVQRNQPSETGVTVVTTIFHSSGQWISDGGLHVPADKKNAQGFGSALTYARRYGLSSMIGIAPDEDDDANLAVSSTQKRTTTTSRSNKSAPSTPSPTPLSAIQREQLVKLSLECGATEQEANKLADNTNSGQFDDRVSKLEARLATTAAQQELG